MIYIKDVQSLNFEVLKFKSDRNTLEKQYEERKTPDEDFR